MNSDDKVEVDTLSDEGALWRLVTALTATATPFEVAEVFTKDGPASAGGTFANMAILTKESNLVQVVHRPVFNPTVVTQRGTFDLNAETPACEAIRTGLPVLLGSPAEIAARFPALLTEIEQAGLSARASLPLRSATGETLGAVGFGWAEPQVFTAARLRRLDLVAQLIGLALERATGYQFAPGQSDRLPRVLETMPNAFFSLDADLTITYINAEGERLLRTSRHDVLGSNFLQAFPEAAGSEFEHQYLRAIESGRSVVFEEYYAPFGGWFEVHAWPDRDGLNVYFSDVSERRDSERQQAVALDEARQAHARLSFLADIGARLHGAASRAELYDRLSEAVTSTVADWTTITVPMGEELVRVAASHRDPVLNGLAKRLVGGYPHPFDGPSPGVVVYLSGKPLRLAELAGHIVTDLDDSVASAAYGRTLQLLGDGPGLIMPIFSKGDVVAVLTMARTAGEPFSDDDVAVLTQVTESVSELLDEALHLETQRETASALQAAALPRTLPSSDRLGLAAGYRAASEGTQVGGDWYDAFELQSGRIALVVGDAAGHGLHAAALMTQMRNALRAHLFDSFGPSESIAKLSSFIASQEPEAFATIICVEVDPITGEGIWASAGHPAPILLRRSGTSRHLHGKPAPPIGSADPQSPDRPIEHPFTLNAGDRLVMFTDGLFERRGIDLEIGLTHLMITTEQTRTMADPEAACESILRGMLTGAHEDDVCLLIADFRSAT
jgi:serine phosphatase RsbU (regulator of sigma subunit)/PAS domain-containing protein